MSKNTNSTHDGGRKCQDAHLPEGLCRLCSYADGQTQAHPGYARAQGHEQQAGDLNSANIEKSDPSDWPKVAKGVGFTEAPRGALGHWAKLKNDRELTKLKIP